MSISVKFLEAYNGDSILISFQGDDGKTKNILIDGGTRHTYVKKRRSGDLKREVELIQKKNEKIDLLVLTHIDDDHIGGILELFKDQKLDKTIIKNLWFNSGRLIAEYLDSSINDQDRNISIGIYNTLETSFQQAIDLETLLQNLNCWDRTIKKRIVVEPIDNCKLTIISPSKRTLKKLHNNWKTKKPESLKNSPSQTDYHIPLINLMSEEDTYKKDSSIPNGSSISFILEYKNRKLLFLGDAHPNVIVESLQELGYTKNKKLRLDLLKVSHHGSKKNTSKKLLELIDCDVFVISTNALKHGLPDKLTLARIIKSNPRCTLLFNYNILGRVFLEEDFQNTTFKAKYLNKEAIQFY
ncbi:MAG: MBL fold metallo-hydrolase [Bacteroidota bacterium]